MKNLTLIIAFIIGTSFALSAQRGGGNNNNTGSNTNIRGNSTLKTNPNLGNTNRGGASEYGRTGNGRPNSHGQTNNGRGGGGHYDNGHNGHNNHGHNGHNNNGHNNNGHHAAHNNGHNGHNNHGHNGHHNNVNVVVTTGHHGHNYNSYCNYSNHNYGWNAVCVADFNIGCRSIRGYGYDADRLRAARDFVRHNYVNAHQIADIMLMFSFESSRLEFAKYAFHRTCDVQNYGVVFGQLSFNSSRRELDCYIRDYQW
jgi:hypothetical protein